MCTYAPLLRSTHPCRDAHDFRRHSLPVNPLIFHRLVCCALSLRSSSAKFDRDGALVCVLNRDRPSTAKAAAAPLIVLFRGAVYLHASAGPRWQLVARCGAARGRWPPGRGAAGAGSRGSKLSVSFSCSAFYLWRACDGSTSSSQRRLLPPASG